MPDLTGIEGGHRGAAEGTPSGEAADDVAGSHGNAQAARCEGAASAASEGTPRGQLPGGGMQRRARCRVHAVQPSAQRQAQTTRPAPLNNVKVALPVSFPFLQASLCSHHACDAVAVFCR